MECGARGRATGENELAKRRQLLFEAIDQSLEPFDVRVAERRFRRAGRHGVRGIGQLRAESEQVALDVDERFVEVRVESCGADEPEPGIQLVDLAVRVHTRIVLAHARAAEKRRVAAVARSRVDFHVRKLYEMAETGSRPKPARKRLPMPAPPDRRRFRQRLLAWYGRNGRDLPWRKTSDPYHILVSEIMLQQTQVDRVLPKYAEWLDKYPSMDALAVAPEREVTKTWYPLGYNIRPRRLQAIAREAVATYGGQLPSDEATLLSFKGIGAYTAGAIRSFAFRQRAAILDTNVARVLYRVFIGKGDAKSHAMKRHLWILSATLMPRRDVFDFNQALMDFGALTCSARNPKCGECPMANGCASFRIDKRNRQA
jgi:A/G-specific adenine glycosylase